MGCRSGGDPLSLELRMGRSQKGCCAGTLLPQAVLNHVDLVIFSPTLTITGPTRIFALCPTAAFAGRLYRLSSGCFFLVAGALGKACALQVWVSLGPLDVNYFPTWDWNWWLLGLRQDASHGSVTLWALHQSMPKTAV